MPTSAPVSPRWTWLPRQPGVPAELQARGWLSAQLDTPPEALSLQRDAWRRPWIAAPFEARDINWSHSGEGLLVALADSGVRVGVDLEWQRPRPRALMLAERYFAAAEHAWLAGMADPQARERAFLRLWCAKEAVLKAHGRGLAFGLDRLRFEDGPGGLRLVACDPDLGTPAGWQLRELEPAPGYLGALAWRPAAAGGAVSGS
nr:4'-phosphopantetheinyl transferase superfamily protein [Lysobacter chinensis]